jgi:hypothetical protein
MPPARYCLGADDGGVLAPARGVRDAGLESYDFLV